MTPVNEPRLCRSMLMTPGNRPDRLLKAATYPADCLVFDLEDSVPPAAKPDARVFVSRALREGNRDGRERCVRINSLDSGFGTDDLDVQRHLSGSARLRPRPHPADRADSDPGDAARNPAGAADCRGQCAYHSDSRAKYAVTFLGCRAPSSPAPTRLAVVPAPSALLTPACRPHPRAPPSRCGAPSCPASAWATTHQYVEASLAMKEKALARLQETDSKIGRYHATDELLEFLRTL